jgi:hypothetical protein
VLLGIVLTADKREAIFQDKKTSSIIRATEGGTVAGWVLKELHPRAMYMDVQVSREAGCRERPSGNPEESTTWIPASAGMTDKSELP